MKKLLTIITAAALTVLTSMNAMAFPQEGKSYVNLNLGYAINNVKVKFAGTSTAQLKPMDRGFAFDVGFGYYVLDEFRIALNPIYARNLTGKKSSGKDVTLITDKSIMSQYGVFANAYYDFLTGGKINPFLMLGLGYVRTETEDRVTFDGGAGKAKDSTNKFAYKGGLGLAYHLSSAIDAELGYSVMKRMGKKKDQSQSSMQDVMPGLTASTEPSATQLVTIGLRFTF